jgi:hypothetical protein
VVDSKCEGRDHTLSQLYTTPIQMKTPLSFEGEEGSKQEATIPQLSK